MHDPMLIVRNGKTPKGPYVKSELNPVTNSGHEVVVWPYKEGICALMTDGPEKNTIQYAPDGLNFEIKAHVVNPPPGSWSLPSRRIYRYKVGAGNTVGLIAHRLHI